MARQRYYHDPARKHIEAYQDYSGGLNTMSSNENIKDNELVVLENVDLGERGSLKRRKGFKSTVIDGVEGKPQMITKFYRDYTPYNLLGVDGSFDGQKIQNGKNVSIGGWYAFNMPDENNVYKIDRGQSQELIVNGNFESGTTGWDLTNAGTVIGQSVTAPEGSNVLRMLREKNEKAFWKNEYQSSSNWLNTKEGEEFYVEAHYRNAVSSVSEKGPQRVHIQISMMYADGSTKRQYINRYDSDYSWKKISGYFKIPRGVKKVLFGLGMYDNRYTEYSAGIYFDAFYARREITGSANSSIALRSVVGDTARTRGVGLKFDGLKPHAYYIYVVDYKTDGTGEGRLAVRDERFGVYPQDNGLVLGKDLTDKPTDWTTKFMKFRTYDGMNQGRAYVYNNAPLGVLSTVFYDNARLYEVTADMYEQLDTMTEQEIAEAFPYRNGKLSSEILVEQVAAIGGKFYIDGVEKQVEGSLPIQTERIMEAVTYKNNLYIASGSGLLVYNGSTIAKVSPYVPDPLETLYIGTNGLVENPYTISDEIQSVVELKKIQFSRRYGVTNEFITITIGVGKPSGTSLQYKVERRNVRDKEGYWFLLRDWDIDNTATFITDIAGEYQFKITVREQGKTAELDEYVIPSYIIKPAADKNDIPIDANTIDLCNRIMLHWDRLIVYGDQAKPDIVYVSDLQNPAYFPMNNTLQFVNPRRERITSIVRYRDNLVVFTDTSIQALFGTNPENFERVMLNTDFGCIADRGAKVVKNYVMFPSREGIALLKTIGQSETRSNVDLIDTNIKNIVEYTPEAVAYVRDNQYCLVYPETKRQLRMYYEWGVWTQDISDSLDFTDVFVEDGDIIALGQDGRLIVDSNDYQDEGIPYLARVETKLYYFGEPYAIKKTKELQTMFDKVIQDTSVTATVSLDTGIIKAEVINLPAGTEIVKTTIAGKGLAIKVGVEHVENKPLTLVGLGFIFKLKNP